jgi:hypothetical protein
MTNVMITIRVIDLVVYDDFLHLTRGNFLSPKKTEERAFGLFMVFPL